MNPLSHFKQYETPSGFITINLRMVAGFRKYDSSDYLGTEINSSGIWIVLLVSVSDFVSDLVAAQ